jgi:ribosomal protein L11 methyltransferase
MKSVRHLRRISVTTTPEAEDAVAEWLSAILGLPASAYADSETGASTVTVYLQRKLRSPRKVRKEISAGLMRIKNCGLKIGPGKIVMARVRREDWAESWKRHFKPIEIKFNNRKDELCESPVSRRKLGTRITRPSEKLGKSLLIKPSWSKRKPRKGQAVVVLDPGLSFGTGQHPTTAFCLHQIVAVVCDRRNRRSQSAATAQSFLDLGTGSGILAIAAAKLGYSPVHAMDFDPEAFRVARANVRTNRVHQKLKIRRGNVTKLPVSPRQRYDLVCANLISNLLITERRRITAQLNRIGTLVLAGILKSEFAEVQKAFEACSNEHGDKLKLCSKCPQNRMNTRHKRGLPFRSPMRSNADKWCGMVFKWQPLATVKGLIG